MRINTEQFKELISKAIKGAGDNKLIPITQLMGIKKIGGVISLITTDTTNYLYVEGKVDSSDEDFEVTVYVDQFSKLISKMTSKEVSLTINDGILSIKGNGIYTLELPLDENGELIKYPSPIDTLSDVNTDNVLAISNVRLVIDSVKPSLATSMEIPALTNYYVGDKVVASDRCSIACYNTDILGKDEELLISSQLMDLLGLMNNDISYVITDTYMLFKSDNITVYSKRTYNASDFPISTINALMTKQFDSNCKVNKNEFIALLDRMSLFVSKYDDKAIRLSFEKDGIRVFNKAAKSNELIPYMQSVDYTEYTCLIDIDILMSQLKAYASDAVEIHYNNEFVIKFVDGNIIQIIALMSETN